MIFGNFKDLNHNLNMCFNNNYRRLHGKHAKRWKYINEQFWKRQKRQLKNIINANHCGAWKITPKDDGGIAIMYVGESEE